MLIITQKTYWQRSIFWCGDPITVHVGNIDDRNAEGGPGNIVHAGNEGSASSSEP